MNLLPPFSLDAHFPSASSSNLELAQNSSDPHWQQSVLHVCHTMESDSSPLDNMQFTATFSSDPLEESFPPDVPITEIEIVAPTTMAGVKLPPTEPRVLSANPDREIISVNDAPVGPDIHDVSRAKIVIRPRCKEYVEKQKQKPASIRTLACFSTSPSKNNVDDDVEIKDDTVRPVAESSQSSSTKTTPSVPKTPKKAKVPPTGPRADRTPTATMRVNPQPLVPRVLATPRRRAVSTGRIEKLPRSRTPSPPRSINAPQLDLGSPLPSFATPDYELQACPCSMPADCQTCTLRRLVDEFCGVVSARKELVRRREIAAQAMADAMIPY
ncbi:hypothetical protein R3P38DRAFT_3040281, partial [Favolaschia claudopus]